MRVIIVLPKNRKNIETFLKELLVLEKRSQFNIDIEFINFETKFTGIKLLELLSLIYFPRRVFKLWFELKSISCYKKFWRIYTSSTLLKQRNVKAVHFLFASNAVGYIETCVTIGAKISIGLRGYDITFYPLNHKNCYNDYFWNNIYSIQYNSEDLYKWALHWGARQSIKSTKITAAVNDEYILDSSKKFIPEKIDCVQLLFVGRLHWKKGIDTLFRIVTILNQQKIKFKLKIVGDGPEMEKCRFLIELLKLHISVELLGKLEQESIISEMDNSDILIAPSIQEGCSNVVLEAQARGLYCIVGESEGMSEVIIDGTNGIICSKFNDSQYVRSIKDYMAKHETDRKQIAIESILRIKKSFNRKQQLKNWMDYFKKL